MNPNLVEVFFESISDVKKNYCQFKIFKNEYLKIIIYLYVQILLRIDYLFLQKFALKSPPHELDMPCDLNIE